MMYDQRQRSHAFMPDNPGPKLFPKLFQAKHAEMITARKFFLLFIFLLGSLVLYPLAGVSGDRYLLFRFFSVVITLLSVYAVSFRRSLVLFAVVLAIPSILQHTILYDFDPSAISVLRMVLSCLFDIFIIVVIFRRVFAHQQPNAETIFGALCIYLLVGFTFASVFSMVGNFEPHSFYLDPATNQHTVPNRLDFIYYSFGTMTSLGAPGITPVSGEARSLTVIESILGVLYLAVLISRLMATYRTQRSESQQ